MAVAQIGGTGPLMKDAGDTFPLIFIPRLRCPGCESIRLRVYGGYEQGDGSRLQYTRCRNCGAEFKVVRESCSTALKSESGDGLE